MVWLQEETVTTGTPVVLLSLFDGIGGAAVSLGRRCADGWKGAFYSSEVDTQCQEVVSARHPHVKHVGDVRKLSLERLTALAAEHPSDALWLIVGGSPCQDLSILRGSGRKGLEGPKSKLFWEFVRVVAQMSRIRRVAFLLENVASMREEDKAEITSALGVDAVTLDATPWCGCRRNRHYWTNIARRDPLQPPAEPIQINALLDEGWTRAGNQPFRCFVSSASRSSGRARMRSGEISRIGDPEETREPNSDEREAMLGFPRGYTELPGMTEQKRLRMVGNSFAVPVVSALIAPVADCHSNRADLHLREVCPSSTLARMDRITDEGGEESSWSDADACIEW